MISEGFYKRGNIVVESLPPEMFIAACQRNKFHSHLHFSGSKVCFRKKCCVFAQTGNHFWKQRFSLRQVPFVRGKNLHGSRKTRMKIRVLLTCSQDAKISWKWFASCCLPIPFHRASYFALLNEPWLDIRPAPNL